MSIGQPQGMLLNEFGERCKAAFGEAAYHVGSSLSAMRDKSREWRDVDVRLMLDDDVWEKLELGDPANPHGNAKWRAFCIVFSDYGRHLTGLPIDFQLQQRTHANATYGRAQNCPRSSLMVVNHEQEWNKLEAAQKAFCLYCGAGIGKFRRDGEGICPECDETIPANKI
jgi:hypothetical protein